jgi:hypothetical protein
MRRIYALSLLSFAIGGHALAAAETCTSYLTAQREKMLVAAMACEGTPTQQQSVRPQVARERNGDKVMSFGECSEPLSVAKSDDIFRGCVRTHLCAAQTYTCAISSTTAHSTVKECGQAMTACQVTDPIPATPP